MSLLRSHSVSLCWSIGMRVYFCTMGGGGGHCTLLAPSGACRRRYFWYDFCHPYRRVVSPINRCLEAQGAVSVYILFLGCSVQEIITSGTHLSAKELCKKCRILAFILRLRLQ